MNSFGFEQMNSFEFGRPVEICGQVCHITNDMQSARSVLEKAARAVARKGATEAQQKFACAMAVDAILGKGAHGRIFEGRRFSLADETQLIQFLSEEVRAWEAELREAMGRQEPPEEDAAHEEADGSDAAEMGKWWDES